MIVGKRLADAQHNTLVMETLTIKEGDIVRKLNKGEVFGKTNENWSKKLYFVVEQIGNRYKIASVDTNRCKRKLASHNDLLKIDNVIQPTTTKKKQVVKQYRTEQKIQREGALDPIIEGKRQRKTKKDDDFEYY